MKSTRDILFDLSARLVSAPHDKIGKEIDAGLKRIGSSWDFDRITLTEFFPSTNENRVIHSYTASRVNPAPLEKIDESIPWIMDKLCRGESILLAKIPDDLPQDAAVDRQYCAREGVTSALSLPLTIGATVFGGCFFASLKKAPSWDSVMLEQLHYISEILANALERMRAGERMDALSRFEHLLSRISAKYINLPGDQMVDVIRSDLERLGRLVGVDRCMIYFVNKTSKTFYWDMDYFWWPEQDNARIESLMRSWKVRDDRFYDNFTYLFDKWTNGEIVQYSHPDQLPKEAASLKKIYGSFGLKSYLSIPMSVAGTRLGALLVATTRNHRSWPEDLVQRLRLFAEVFANAISRKENEGKIQSAFFEIKTLKEQIEADYLYLTEEIKLEHGDIVGQSPALKRMLAKVKQVAATDAPVLLLGETGTGKGLIARSIHDTSKHRTRPLVQVNCAALTPSLIESELFGHEKGAFTGAATRRIGRFEQAHGTTLFLDEIGELPLNVQPKLLRVLQEGEFERVGGVETLKTHVRIIAATNRDLEKDVEDGKFRKDLWYRLCVFPITIPPLRERLEDIPLLVKWFVEKYSKWIGKEFNTISKKMLDALKRYAWPGNIRELENLIERAAITSPAGNLTIELPTPSCPQPDQEMTLQEVERSHLINMLEKTDWVVEGSSGAARRLGLNASTLRFRMKKLGIQRP
ncbi:MAG: sigma 54-interacting transcriptional regulator, partial [Desulfatitalea sp.]|nr:sigma 54-interacting transcriptional regulator [Desulfatitalea sp.]NNK01193.1 sigma 54-interacting transcriptional regulator [Desulfatitalea sp.]